MAPGDPLPAAPAGDSRTTRQLSLFVLFLAAIIIWFSAGDHPLYSPDEGRYGTVSLHMAEGGSWIVPEYRGRVHLTKPPLTYWAEASAIRLLGPTESAVRLPSLLASMLTLLIVYLTARRIAGARVAALSVGTLSMMPLYVIVGRLATTDAMLTFFWFSTLAGGYFAVETGRGKPAVLMWIAVAGGLLTKGPLALIPFALLLIWLLLAGRWRALGRLRIALGLPLSLVPLALWVFMVLRLLGARDESRNPFGIWYDEIVRRVTGEGGDHPEAIWYYLPVLLAGLLPATAMLTLPGWNLSLRSMWKKVRAGEGTVLWALAVVLPFVMFSLMSGKLATYLLPLCAPLAILNGLMLERWLTGEADSPPERSRPPEVVKTLGVATLLLAAAIIVAAAIYKPDELWSLPPLLILPVAALWLLMIWKRRPPLRTTGLAVVWLSWMVVWLLIFEMEDDVMESHSSRTLVRRLQDMTGDANPAIYTFGFSDPTLSFYDRLDTARVESVREILDAIAGGPGHRSVMLVDDDSIDELLERIPAALEMMQRTGTWERSLTRSAGIYLPVAPVAENPDNE